MTQGEFTRLLAVRANISVQEAERLLSAFKEVSTQVLESGDKVTLTGFITMTPVDKPARKGRNPQTGEAIHVMSKRVVKFKPLTALRDRIDRSKPGN